MEKVFFKEFEIYRTTEFEKFVELPSYFFEDTSDELTVPILKISEDYYTRWKEKNTSYNKENFDNNFNNIFSSISKKNFKFKIEKNDKKVSLKIYQYTKFRPAGLPYYKISTSCVFLTYSRSKNLIYRGFVKEYHKKRKFTKNVRVINFSSDFIFSIINEINLLSKEIQNNSINLEFLNKNLGHEIMNIFIENVLEKKPDKNYSLLQNLFHYKLNKDAIKLPNNWSVFSAIYPQPNKKIYKENKFKLIDSFMSINGLKGDKIKKVLHNINKFDLNCLRMAIDLFGESFILSQEDLFIKKMFESPNVEYHSQIKFDFTSKKERNNVFEIFKLLVDGEINLATFIDHFSLLKKLKRYENVRWNSNTYVSFLEEHLDFTEKDQFYTKGIFKRVYGKNFKTFIETPITVGVDTFYPKVLETSNDYNTESFIQSNCVKGYVDRASSLIISFRENEIESKNRLTIEYKVTKNKKIVFKRVQTLGRFNKFYESNWEKPLELLDEKFKHISDSNLFELPKLNCKVGYQNFETESKFVSNDSNYSRYTISLIKGDDEILSWVDDKPMKSHYENNF